MPYTDRKRYPGLSRLRGGLRSRSRTEMPRPEARVPNRKVVPKIPPFATKAGLSINMPQSSKTGETSPGAEARKTLGWGGQKFAGNMTTDQFVTLAGALGHAIAPDTPQGRVGSVLSQFGQQEQKRRVGMAELLRQERLKKEETLRLEDREAKRFHTETLLKTGKEERGYEHAKDVAGTLAGAKTKAAETLAGTKVTAAKTLAGTKADAERIKATAKKLEEEESIRQFDVQETRLGKEKGEKGLTTYQKAQLGHDKLEYMQKWEKENFPPPEPDYDSWFESTNEKKRKDYEQKLAAWERKREKVLKDYDTAISGAEKGPGFLGTLKRPDGSVSTELSIGVIFDGKEVEIPTLVPTLTKAEVNELLNLKPGEKPSQAIVNKAVKHARPRIKAGESPFYQEGEKAGKETRAKEWDIAEVKAILKKAGMSQTDKNIEQFMKMNPR